MKIEKLPEIFEIRFNTPGYSIGGEFVRREVFNALLKAAWKLEDNLAPHQFGVNEAMRKAITEFRAAVAKIGG